MCRPPSNGPPSAIAIANRDIAPGRGARQEFVEAEGQAVEARGLPPELFGVFRQELEIAAVSVDTVARSACRFMENLDLT